MKSQFILVRSDTHAGMRFALMRPGVALPQEPINGVPVEDYKPRATAAQIHLWGRYIKDIAKAKTIIRGRETCFIDLAEMTEGLRWMRELVTTRMSDQFWIARDNLQPIIAMKNISHFRFVTGTGVHVFQEGSSAQMIANSLALETGRDFKVADHWLLNLWGVKIDLAHHGPWPGSRNWLKGNVLRYDIRSMMIDSIGSGEDPPDLVLRGHYHQYVPEIVEYRSNGRTYRTWVSISPSYALLNSHSLKATRSTPRVTNGMLLYEIRDGKIIERHEMIETIDLRTRETIN